MKLFLRYQISGMVFIMWCVIFYHGGKTSEFNGFFQEIKCSIEEIKDIKSLALILVAIALPIGVLIHQLSVVIKNLFVASKKFGVGLKWTEFDDHPNSMPVNIDYEKDSHKYFLKRISNLNSFYYVRVDNGVLAPLLAFFSVLPFSSGRVIFLLLLVAIVIGFVTVFYVGRIRTEIDIYRKKLEKKDPFKAIK